MRDPYCSTCRRPAVWDEHLGVLHVLDNQPVPPERDFTGHCPDLDDWTAGLLLPGDRVRHGEEDHPAARAHGTGVIAHVLAVRPERVVYAVLRDLPRTTGESREVLWPAAATEYVATPPG